MTEQPSTSFRQNVIKELLKRHLISDQRKIVELLREYHSIETNQAAVSRDLRKLGVVKKQRNGTMTYEVPEADTQTEVLKTALVDIVCNEATIVIKTHPGLAAFVGDCLDEHPDLEIIGCIAGENTVFVAPKSIKDIDTVCQNICLKFQFKKTKDS